MSVRYSATVSNHGSSFCFQRLYSMQSSLSIAPHLKLACATATNVSQQRLTGLQDENQDFGCLKALVTLGQPDPLCPACSVQVSLKVWYYYLHSMHPKYSDVYSPELRHQALLLAQVLMSRVHCLTYWKPCTQCWASLSTGSV